MPVYHAMETETARRYQAGAPDAYGNPPEHAVSDGGGNPCRHCLNDIPAGAPMLVLAWQPFSGAQPYAETGPVFLCAHECTRHEPAPGLPALFSRSKEWLVRGYDGAQRIAYGTGRVVPVSAVDDYVSELLQRSDIAHVDLRSATNNCYQCRARRD